MFAWIIRSELAILPGTLQILLASSPLNNFTQADLPKVAYIQQPLGACKHKQLDHVLADLVCIHMNALMTRRL